MANLVFVRHGQSVYNFENRFTGNIDSELTALGMQEAEEAGKKLKDYQFQFAFTSTLKRAQKTLEIILEEINQQSIPIEIDAALNERMYGSLQGLNKAETAEKYGASQVDIWRRSYDIPPPEGESLKDTYNRVVPYYKSNIEPLLAKENNVLITAHGNSLRALMMYLENISPQAITEINIPTGSPRLYNFDLNMKILDASYLV